MRISTNLRLSTLAMLPVLVGALSSLFRARAALQLENLALRHQIGVLQRSVKKRPKLTAADPILWAWLCGVNPKLIITGHENEMGHTVDHREDYTQTYNHPFGTQYHFIVMAWGESYQYRR